MFCKLPSPFPIVAVICCASIYGQRLDLLSSDCIAPGDATLAACTMLISLVGGYCEDAEYRSGTHGPWQRIVKSVMV
jgi:hypothetical protein